MDTSEIIIRTLNDYLGRRDRDNEVEGILKRCEDLNEALEIYTNSVRDKNVIIKDLLKDLQNSNKKA